MSDTTRIFIKDLYLIDIKSKHVHSIFDGMKIGRSKLDVSYADDSGLSHEHCKITVEEEGAKLVCPSHSKLAALEAPT